MMSAAHANLLRDGGELRTTADNRDAGPRGGDPFPLFEALTRGKVSGPGSLRAGRTIAVREPNGPRIAPKAVSCVPGLVSRGRLELPTN
jgi:hypothetical protein